MSPYFRKLYIYIILCFVLTNVLQSQKVFSQIYVTFNNTNNILIPMYVDCFIDYRTSQCDGCPPHCLSLNSTGMLIEHERLVNNIHKVFENSLRQISIINSGLGKNDTNTAITYLQSLFLKSQINSSELILIYDTIKDIQSSNSIIEIGQNMKENIRLLTNDTDNSPTAISILYITSKSIDLLINKDNIVTNIHEHPNLPYNFYEQKNWVTKVLANTIVGCELSGVLGCLTSSVSATGIL